MNGVELLLCLNRIVKLKHSSLNQGKTTFTVASYNLRSLNCPRPSLKSLLSTLNAR